MNRIRSERAMRGLTQKQLAKMVGVASMTIVRWEAGAMPNSEYLIKLRNIFGVSIDWLMGVTDERHVVKPEE